MYHYIKFTFPSGEKKTPIFSKTQAIRTVSTASLAEHGLGVQMAGSESHRFVAPVAWPNYSSSLGLRFIIYTWEITKARNYNNMFFFLVSLLWYISSIYIDKTF